MTFKEFTTLLLSTMIISALACRNFKRCQILILKIIPNISKVFQIGLKLNAEVKSSNQPIERVTSLTKQNHWMDTKFKLTYKGKTQWKLFQWDFALKRGKILQETDTKQGVTNHRFATPDCAS